VATKVDSGKKQLDTSISGAVMDMNNEQEVRQLKTIAALYVKRSKLREAEGVYKAVLKIQEAQLGQFSPDIALTCYQLAEVYTNLLQYSAARPLFEQAVKIWEILSGLELIKPEENIFFMDALVALQLHQSTEHVDGKTEHRSAA
jgi:tetratricopeptide (TPR) repeat protein